MIDVDEFVGVKSHRAKGKRLTTYDVDRLRMIEPERLPSRNLRRMSRLTTVS